MISEIRYWSAIYFLFSWIESAHFICWREQLWWIFEACCGLFTLNCACAILFFLWLQDARLTVWQCHFVAQIFLRNLLVRPVLSTWGQCCCRLCFSWVTMSQTPRGCVDLMFFLSHFSLKYIVICISTELRQEPPPVPDGDRAPPALGNKVSISGHPLYSQHIWVVYLC